MFITLVALSHCDVATLMVINISILTYVVLILWNLGNTATCEIKWS